EPADGPEGLIAVGFETRVRQQVVPISLGIERLWQEDRDAGNVDVAGFVIEAGGDLQSPGADTEPIEEAIIGIEPIERRIVVAETAKVAREQLGAKAQAWRQLLGKVDPNFAELEATVLGLREEVVVRGVDESLTDETVCFEVEPAVFCFALSNGVAAAGDEQQRASQRMTEPGAAALGPVETTHESGSHLPKTASRCQGTCKSLATTELGRRLGQVQSTRQLGDKAREGAFWAGACGIAQCRSSLVTLRVFRSVPN